MFQPFSGVPSRRFRVRRDLMGLTLTAGLAFFLPTPASAQAPTIHLEAQALSSALLEFGRQTGLTVLVDPALVEGRSAPAIEAETDPRKALDRLLRGSGLQARIDDGVVTVARPASTSSRPRPIADAQAGATGSGSSQPRDVVEFTPMVVSAAGYTQSIVEAPASITIVTREELERRPFVDLTDALRDVPGAAATGAEGRNQSISLRGFGNGYTLILVDGKRQNLGTMSRTGNNNTSQSFVPPLAAIERIEVVRGPMSTLNGSDAMGGVINIITRKVADDWGGEIAQDYTASESSDFGNGRTSDFFLNGPIYSDKVGIQLFGRDTATEEDNFYLGTPEKSNRNLNARLWITPTDDQDILFEYGKAWFKQLATCNLDNGERGIGLQPDGNCWSRLEYWNPSTERETWSIAHTGRWSFGTSDIAFYKEDAINSSGNIADNKVFDAKLTTPFSLLGEHYLVTGLQHLENTSNNWSLIGQSSDDEITVITDKQTSYFVEDEWKFARSLALTLGIRLDDHDAFGQHWSPRAYLVWNATEAFAIKGGVATGFKAPRIDYVAEGLVSESESATESSYTYSNPDLDPETSTNYEIGGIWHNDAGLLASVTVFHTEFKNRLVVVEQTGMDPFAYCEGVENCTWNQRENVDRAISQGAEASIKAPMGKKLSARLSYTYLETEQKSGPNQGLPLNRVPDHQAVATVDWRMSRRLSSWYSARYRGQEEGSTTRPAPTCAADESCGDYTLFDMGASFRVNDALKLDASLYNLGDKRVNFNDYARVESGRRLYLRAGYTF